MEGLVLRGVRAYIPGVFGLGSMRDAVSDDPSVHLGVGRAMSARASEDQTIPLEEAACSPHDEPSS